MVTDINRYVVNSSEEVMSDEEGGGMDFQDSYLRSHGSRLINQSFATTWILNLYSQRACISLTQVWYQLPKLKIRRWRKYVR